MPSDFVRTGAGAVLLHLLLALCLVLPVKAMEDDAVVIHGTVGGKEYQSAPSHEFLMTGKPMKRGDVFDHDVEKLTKAAEAEARKVEGFSAECRVADLAMKAYPGPHGDRWFFVVTLIDDKKNVLGIVLNAEGKPWTPVVVTDPFQDKAEENDNRLPPVERRAEWAKLEEKGFAKWSIRGFTGWTEPFDGGSKVFGFETDEGGGVDVVVANPGYWTAAERKAGRQVFFVIHDRFFHHVQPGSDGEKQLIAKLEKAADELTGEGERNPKLIKDLAARLKSRDPVFKAGD